MPVYTLEGTVPVIYGPVRYFNSLFIYSLIIYLWLRYHVSQLLDHCWLCWTKSMKVLHNVNTRFTIRSSSSQAFNLRNCFSGFTAENWPCSFLLWGEVIASLRISDPIYSIKQITLCLKKRGVELFAITSSTVTWFWKFCHCRKQEWICCKINIILLSPLKNFAVLPCET